LAGSEDDGGEMGDAGWPAAAADAGSSGARFITVLVVVVVVVPFLDRPTVVATVRAAGLLSSLACHDNSPPTQLKLHRVHVPSSVSIDHTFTPRSPSFQIPPHP